MKRLSQIAAIIVAGVGAAVTFAGVFMVGFGVFGQKQPPPSLNEGHGLLFALGIATGVIGTLLLWTGLAVRAGLSREIRSAAAAPGNLQPSARSEGTDVP